MAVEPVANEKDLSGLMGVIYRWDVVLDRKALFCNHFKQLSSVVQRCLVISESSNALLRVRHMYCVCPKWSYGSLVLEFGKQDFANKKK